MTAEDLKKYKQIFPYWKDRVGRCKKILLLSPNIQQVLLMRRLFFFSSITIWSQKRYDLNYPMPDSFDLIAAFNIFHYSDNPTLWFDHILPKCKFFLLQDLINRQRQKLYEFDDDGDSMRYSFSSKGVISKYSGSFDLSQYDHMIEDFVVYDGGGVTGAGIPGALHFLLLMHGTLSKNS